MNKIDFISQPKKIHKIITINVMKFLWGVIFPYKGIDAIMIYRKKGKYIRGHIPYPKMS